ncbi:hypothetical protein AAFF_G00033230 [Aldrovandia affinis]|uniref:Uncharacterized protein n=1 Tax=Aldrovandia affinis TaxID=143900 RepID=A0AAD7WFX4_9TELE|nr:hypothetical protein AAFF_G00033230 [Aldrovandia affinis]
MKSICRQPISTPEWGSCLEPGWCSRGFEPRPQWATCTPGEAVALVGQRQHTHPSLRTSLSFPDRWGWKVSQLHQWSESLQPRSTSLS